MSESIFASRRAELLRRMGPHAVAIFPSTPEARRNSDVEHHFRQDSDVHYLTGCEEPESVVVLSTAHPEHAFTLFLRPRDKEQETWTGRRLGVEGAVKALGANAAFSTSELDAKLPAYFSNAERFVFRVGGTNPEIERRVLSVLSTMRMRSRSGQIPPDTIVDPGALLHEMRLIKSSEEVATLRRAAALTADGHLAAMRSTRPGLREYQVQAMLEERYRAGGAVYGWGYYPIVATGANATILHYHENNAELRDGDLLLIDSGAEFDFYTADVTRTFPVNGRFTKPQSELYEITLAAADHGIALTRPGATLDGIHDACTRALIEGLLRVGLLSGTIDSCIEDKSYRKYYMHRTSHWLGMDVHDAGAYYVGGKPRPLAPGMVLTIEPGLYVAADEASAPEKYRGIGIRIEDDILVTSSGSENLTAAIPRTVADLTKVQSR